jgi:hypothetical protein
MGGSLVAKWTIQLIEDTKARYKLEFDSILAAKGEGVKLSAILERLDEFADTEDESQQLDIYVLIVSALIHHLRFGGLQSRSIRHMEEKALAILRINGIEPGKGRLAFLHGELYSVLSQVNLNIGNPILSAWMQQQAQFVSGKGSVGDKGFQHLALAIRYMGLGNVTRAIECYKLAESVESYFVKARMGRLKALRITGRLDEVDKLIQETYSVSKDEKILKELQWETALAETSRQNSGQPLYSLVRKGASHAHGFFLGEAFLWFHALRSPKFLEKLPDLAYLAGAKVLEPKKMGFFFKAIRTIRALYDTEIPSSIRLSRLGHLLNDARKVVSLDREMLVWVAAARWLARGNYFTLATIALEEYREISLKVSQGSTQDVLQIAGDLFEKTWFGIQNAERP